ncbi:MAG TPA: hypothetical protein VFY67_06210 [Pyrinomonadaceae bacterium]|nr:hypothetical protein [Pyrinomonadaceae bacterium]
MKHLVSHINVLRELHLAGSASRWCDDMIESCDREDVSDRTPARDGPAWNSITRNSDETPSPEL